MKILANSGDEILFSVPAQIPVHLCSVAPWQAWFCVAREKMFLVGIISSTSGGISSQKLGGKCHFTVLASLMWQSGPNLLYLLKKKPNYDKSLYLVHFLPWMLARTNCRQILTNNNNNNNNSNNKQAGTRTIQSTTKGACVPVCQFSSAYFCGILHSQTHHCKLLHLYLSSHLPKFVPASCIRICENVNIFVHVTPLCCFLEDRSTRWFVIWIHCADEFCPVARYT